MHSPFLSSYVFSPAFFFRFFSYIFCFSLSARYHLTMRVTSFRSTSRVSKQVSPHSFFIIFSFLLVVLSLPCQWFSLSKFQSIFLSSYKSILIKSKFKIRNFSLSPGYLYLFFFFHSSVQLLYPDELVVFLLKIKNHLSGTHYQSPLLSSPFLSFPLSRGNIVMKLRVKIQIIRNLLNSRHQVISVNWTFSGILALAGSGTLQEDGLTKRSSFYWSQVVKARI